MRNLAVTHKRLIVGGVLLGLAAALLLRWNLEASTDSEIAASGSPKREATRVSASSLTGDRRPALPQLPSTTEEIITQALQSDEKLGAFMALHDTVLPDAVKREEYRELLSSLDMMTAMAEALMDPGSGRVEPAEPYRRLMQIDYFEAALAWTNNPRREKVLELVGAIITKDNFRGDQDSARRQMLGGTKMELYRLMYEQDAPRAQEMVALAKGTRMESLVSWMAHEELRRRTREAEIVKDAEALQAQAN